MPRFLLPSRRAAAGAATARAPPGATRCLTSRCQPARLKASPSRDIAVPSDPLLKQFIAFAVVGLFGTAAHFLVLHVLVSRFGVSPVAGSSAGFVAGALVNYGLNYRLTFRSQKRHRDALPRFLAVAGGGWLLNGLLLAVVLSWANIHYLLAQVVVTGAVLLWNFLANRYWTFRER
ncbi:MAG: GtrA family protein [Candidatus Accumulibacter sp.]|nr:GtrA family protein [Accumulibacter sp.]